MNIKLFKETYKILKPCMNSIVDIVNSGTPEALKYAKHINRMGAIVQYAYYVSVMRNYIDNKKAIVVDWGAIWTCYKTIEGFLSKYNFIPS